MQKIRKLVVLPLALFTLSAGSATAGQQPHVVSPNQLYDVMAMHSASQDANRAAVRESLTRPEVKRVADSMGVNVDRLAAAVDTMTGADLEQAASAARQVNQQLVGGDSSVTLSTTTIIIGLLVLILLIVAIH